MHRKVAVALVAALALGLASCGGGQETETTGGGGAQTGTVSRAQLVKRLEPVCLAAQSAPQQEGDTQQAAAARTIAAQLTAIRDEVGGLELSGAQKADLDAYKATLAPRLEVLERIASTEGAEQQQAVRAAQAVLEPASVRARAALDRLGLRHVCI